MELKHCVYPQRNIEGRPKKRIMILDILRGFFLVHRKQWLIPKNWVKMGMKNPSIRDVWKWTIDWYSIMGPHTHLVLGN